MAEAIAWILMIALLTFAADIVYRCCRVPVKHRATRRVRIARIPAQRSRETKP